MRGVIIKFQFVEFERLTFWIVEPKNLWSRTDGDNLSMFRKNAKIFPSEWLAKVYLENENLTGPYYYYEFIDSNNKDEGAEHSIIAFID